MKGRKPGLKSRIQKNEERIRNLWDNIEHSNIQIIGAPEGGEQEIKNLLEKIMKENLHNLVKEIDFQEVQEAQSPKVVGHKEAHIIITLLKIKDKES